MAMKDNPKMAIITNKIQKVPDESITKNDMQYSEFGMPLWSWAKRYSENLVGWWHEYFYGGDNFPNQNLWTEKYLWWEIDEKSFKEIENHLEEFKSFPNVMKPVTSWGKHRNFMDKLNKRHVLNLDHQWYAIYRQIVRISKSKGLEIEDGWFDYIFKPLLNMKLKIKKVEPTTCIMCNNFGSPCGEHSNFTRNV